jgi:uncharacterized membrane protein (UPF0182 family)
VTDDFDSPEDPRPQAAPRPVPANRRVLLPTLITLAVLMFGGAVFTGLWTDRLWFKSLDYGGVFNTILLTRATLFVVFGVVFALVVCANIVVAYRTQPLVVPRPRRFDPVVRYREVIEPVRKRLLGVVFVLLLLAAGGVAAGQWQTFALWRDGTDFGTTDAEFNKDIGFFVFDYPWLRFVTSYGFAVLAVSIIAVALINYVYGGITLANRNSRVAPATQVHLSVLVGLFVLLKAFAYWLDRFGLAIEDGTLISGITYTDANARIPSKNILIVIAIICALLFFANVVRRSWLLPALGLGMLVLSSVLIGGIWPAIMQSFQVKPSEPVRENEFIQRNIEATRDAFGVSDVQETPYDAQTDLEAEQLEAEAAALPGIRLLDPTLVSDAFEQLQQVRGYYSVPESLDVDRYQFEGSELPQDVVIAARELDLDGLSESQRNWASDHTVYTHGYGVVAARGNQRGNQGEPSFVIEDIPLRSSDPSLEVDQPRIYFGEQSPEYSIVGRDDDVDIEVDTPQAGSTDEDESSTSTYDGTGGVEVGGLFHKMLYALKFGEPNIVLSDRVNSESKILYDRVPRDRVEKVAPWLTVDGNSYPSIVDGRIVWIVDAYTTSNSFPQSEKISLDDATSDTLTATSQVAALPNDQVNYMRNSVKAVVDAYDGTVTLYEWDEEDPILQTWMKVFPDVVKDKSEIGDDLLSHLRYPEDLFKVQRDILSRYHVTEADVFYNDGERWLVPEDPTTDGSAQPPYYLSVQTPGSEAPKFSLTSVFVPNGRENLASFVSVNADATDDGENGYGTMEILALPSSTQVPGPNQMQNQINTDETVVDGLFPFRERSTVLPGNLLTLPVGEGLLYVQPIYTRATGDTGTYPVLQFVAASFGDEVGLATTLDCALNQVLGVSGECAENPTQPPGGPDEPGGEGQPGEETVQDLLDQAATAFEEAQAALAEGELGVYQDKVDEANDLVEEAAALLAEQTGQPTGPDGEDEPADPQAEESTEPEA